MGLAEKRRPALGAGGTDRCWFMVWRFAKSLVRLKVTGDRGDFARADGVRLEADSSVRRSNPAFTPPFSYIELTKTAPRKERVVRLGDFLTTLRKPAVAGAALLAAVLAVG